MRKQEQSSSTLVLLDGNALVHRAYHALPPLTNKRGELVNAVYGFALTLLSVVEKFHPKYIVASFDLPKPTFRHEKFPEYKATRAKAPDELYAQFPRVKELVRAFGIPIYEQEGFEADDCVGTLARQATELDEHLRAIIVTGDNDALQLVSDRIGVFSLRKGVKDTMLYDEANVFAKYGFPPKTLIEYKGLRGDASDNIPGVRGIGEKGATDLLVKYATLDGVYDHIDELPAGIRKKLEDGRALAFLSRELGTIDTHAPIVIDLPACQTKEFDRSAVEALFRELGFFSLLKKIPGTALDDLRKTLSQTKKNSTRLLHDQKEIAQFFHEISSAQYVSFLLFPEQKSLFQSMAFTCEIGFRSAEKYECARIEYTAENHAIMKKFFESDISKTSYDMKSAMKLLKCVDIELCHADFDVMIAGYLLNAGGNISLEMLVSEYVQESISTASAVSVEQIFHLHDIFSKKMEELSRGQAQGKTLFDLFKNIEMPLVTSLFRMEGAGVCLNVSVLNVLSDEMKSDLEKISKEIYMFAGREFNINSPKQLAEVLFVDLKIPSNTLRHTKTGISTASPELSKLRGDYPIVALVEEYRERFKLKTTYLDTLPKLLGADGRIHTTFQQAVTATGRLSSSDPNTQNIPIRNEWGTRIRSAFEAESGKLLVGADYSQIELRVAAHLSQDAQMCTAFERGEDIHRRTASLVYHIEPDAVTSEMRRRAKVFNFGILYGMGSHGLAQAAGIGYEEATTFIREYLEHFSGIKSFMDSMKQSAREHGFVETELGRRRFLPEIVSDNKQVSASAERMAINMPVQGLEADIVKLAMIASDDLIAQKFQGKARMILQIHDELIFEVEESVATSFAEAIKKTMESVYTLRVPLIADVSLGKNWGEI